jgi:predicted Zn-dependent protease
MANGSARWTPTFALRAGVGSALTIAVIAAVVQGVRFRSPGVCVSESYSPWRAAPWALVAVVPSLVLYLVRAIAARAPEKSIAVGVGAYRASVVTTKLEFKARPSHDYVRGVVALLAIALGIAQTRTWSCTLSLPASCHPSLKKIVLVPVGTIDPSVVASLAKHFHDCYSLPVSVGATLVPPQTAYDEKRKQWIAENLMDAIPACKTGDPLCEPTLTIGITDYDMYMSTYAQQLNWIYTADNVARHVDIVSTFRMDLPGGHIERASKIVARDLALDYCGLDFKEDRKSVLGPRLGGQNDLDEMDESIW